MRCVPTRTWNTLTRALVRAVESPQVSLRVFGAVPTECLAGKVLVCIPEFVAADTSKLPLFRLEVAYHVAAVRISKPKACLLS